MAVSEDSDIRRLEGRRIPEGRRSLKETREKKGCNHSQGTCQSNEVCEWRSREVSVAGETDRKQGAVA